MTDAMTDALPNPPQRIGEQLFGARISSVAASALAADFSRHPGPKHGIVVATATTALDPLGLKDSGVLTAAIDALSPDDRLTVVAGEATEQIRSQIHDSGAWVEQRVQVVATLAEADSADAIIVADLVTGDADETRLMLGTLAKSLHHGGVVSLAVAAAPFLTNGAGAELERQAALCGVGTDLVVRNLPPVRVHRLRFSPADATLAERLAPMERTSSVRITPDVHLDSSGVVAAAVCLGAAALTRMIRPRSRLWLLPALAAGPVAAFFRDPERVVPDDPTAVVAASDGRVLSVERVSDERLGSEDFLRIAVFLSVLDVHINRAPVAGRVVDHFVVAGGYAAAMASTAEHNVTGYTVLETRHGTVAVAQRTGVLARRIIQRTPVGALLARGERIGLICFGSRTDIYLPADAVTTAVAPGDRVTGGHTVVARWNT